MIQRMQIIKQFFTAILRGLRTRTHPLIARFILFQIVLYVIRFPTFILWKQKKYIKIFSKVRLCALTHPQLLLWINQFLSLIFGFNTRKNRPKGRFGDERSKKRPHFRCVTWKSQPCCQKRSSNPHHHH